MSLVKYLKYLAHASRPIEILLASLPILGLVSLVVKLNHVGTLVVVVLIKSIILALCGATALLNLKSNKRHTLSNKAFVGLIFSYSSLLFIETHNTSYFVGLKIKLHVLFILIFTIGWLLWALITTRGQFSIVPVAQRKDIWTSGPYQYVRHPFYFAYLLGFLCLTANNITILNIIGFIMLMIGLNLRADTEEKLLISNEKYKNYKSKVKYRFLNLKFILLLGLPFSIFWVIDFQRESKRPIYVFIPTKFVTFDPTLYDDWSSLFVVNHTLVPLVNSLSTSGPVVSTHYTSRCIQFDNTGICVRHQMLFKLNKLKGCDGSQLTKGIIEQELKHILSKKNWIFKNPTLCKTQTNEICLETNFTNDWETKLKNLYFRFGFSSHKNNSLPFGFGTHCMFKDTKDGILLKSNFNELNDIVVSNSHSTSQKQEVPDIILFGNFNFAGYRLVNTYAPLAYYMVFNHLSSTLVSEEFISHIKNTFLKHNLIENTFLAPWLPQGNNSNLVSNKTFLSKKFKLLIPNYLDTCSDIKHEITHVFNKTDVLCVNTIDHIQHIIDGSISYEWDAFISPLTPGAYSDNALELQYFNTDSHDSWVRHTPESNFYTLIGAIQTKVITNPKTICGVNSTPLGLGDITIADFDLCNSFRKPK